MMKVTAEVTPENLLERVAAFQTRRYRFVTMTAVDSTTHFDIYYHFDDNNYELLTLQLKLERKAILPSISKIYFAALIVENEIQDLFGIKLENLVLDYHGRFLLAEGAPDRPFCRVPGVGVSIMEPKTAGGEA